jgi:hypothetical protein
MDQEEARAVREQVLVGRVVAERGWPDWCPCSCPCLWAQCEDCRAQYSPDPAPQPETRLAGVAVWITGHACRPVCRCWPCNSRRMPSPMPIEDADQVLVQVHRPRLGRQSLQPFHMGQDECLHLATPLCRQCTGGYHSSCTEWSWPCLHETWIRDSGGSDMFWAEGSHYLVWTAPRECACPCETAALPTAALAPRPHRPAAATAPALRPAVVQESLFDLEVS